MNYIETTALLELEAAVRSLVNARVQNWKSSFGRIEDLLERLNTIRLPEYENKSRPYDTGNNDREE